MSAVERRDGLTGYQQWRVVTRADDLKLLRRTDPRKNASSEKLGIVVIWKPRQFSSFKDAGF